MKRFILIILIGFFGIKANCQVVISGKVSNNDGTLPGANVYIDGTYDGVSTDANGFFSFKTSKTGKAMLKAEFLGYTPFSQEVELNSTPVKVEIKLEVAFNKLNAVTITAGTFEAGDKKQAVILSPLDMVTTAGAGGSVYGALQNLPGTTTNGESGRLFVKGGDSEESQTYIDGSLVYAPYNSSAPNMSVRGRFNPFMFKGTIFSTGGYSAEYGQALSSVLLLNTTDMPDKDRLDVSLLTIGAQVAGTKLWESGGVTASLSYNNLMPYMKLTSQNYNWIRPPVMGDVAISVRQKTGKTGLLKLYSNINRSIFTISQQDLNQENTFYDYKLQNDNYFVNASWRSSLSDTWNVATAASYTSNSDKVKYQSNAFEKKLTGVHVKSVFSNQVTDMFTLRFGTELFSKTISQNFESAPDIFKNDYTNNTVSGFAEAELYASQKLVFRLGGRAEYSDYLKRANASPRLSAAFKLNPFSQLSAAYGWFYQNPIDDYLLYTRQLNYERADHYTFSYQLSENNRTLRAEVYYKDYRNLTKFQGNAFYLPESYSNTGDGYAYGLDVFWRDKKSIKHGDYWISYSYLDTKRDYRNYPGESIPTFASKHTISVVYKHWFGSLRSLVSINAKYSTPRVFNNPNSSVFNGEKMLPYRSFDIGWSFLYKQHIVFYAAVTNVPGFKNEFGNKYAATPDANGVYRSAAIQPGSDRFYLLGCFITLTKKGDENQLDKIE